MKKSKCPHCIKKGLEMDSCDECEKDFCIECLTYYEELAFCKNCEK